MVKQAILLVVVLCSFGHLTAQTVVEIDDTITEHNFMPYELTYYIDSTNTLSFPDVSSHAFANHFSQYPSYQNKDFKTDASYWIRLPIRHTRNTKKVWLLEFYDQ